MAVPTLITDLSTTAASNAPAGSDSPIILDDIQRAHAAFIAQLRDRDSSFALTLLDDADAAAARTTLGVIGDGQTWTNVKTTPGRVANTTYTNSTGRPIVVAIDVQTTAGVANVSAALYVGVEAVQTGFQVASTSCYYNLSAIVPAGQSYSVQGSNFTIASWKELR